MQVVHDMAWMGGTLAVSISSKVGMRSGPPFMKA